MREAQVLIEQWRNHYNTLRPHSALGYRPPAPQTGAIVPAGDDQSQRHLALCHYLKNDYRTAYQIADEIAARYPAWVDIQVLTEAFRISASVSESSAIKCRMVC